jgi:Mn-dependent DtxR family transcriptional regulator
VSPKSSGFEKNLSTLRTGGLIAYPVRGQVTATPEGEALGSAEVAATQAELHAYVRRLIGESRWRVLSPLIDVYDAPLSREELAGRAGVSSASSGFEKNLSTLRSLGLIDYPERGVVVALEVLFP